MLFRNAKALLPRINSGAPSVTPRLRRDEQGVSHYQTPIEFKLGHYLRRRAFGAAHSLPYTEVIES